MKKMKQVPSTHFKKDLKRLGKSGRYDLGKIKEIMDLIVTKQKLPDKCVNHKLTGFENRWDCHIEGDWVLLYELDSTTNTAYWIRTGKHSDLFG